MDDNASNKYNNYEVELEKKNRELEEEITKNKVMLDAIGDGVVGINSAGQITFTNRSFERISGFSTDEVIGKYLIHTLKLVDEQGKDVSMAQRPIRNALMEKKRVVSTDYYYLKKDGSKFAVAITATPIVLSDNVIGGVNIFRDITKEREVDRMKTEFISLASHQLRTPLSAMKWFTEMLMDNEAGDLTQEQKEIVNNIYTSNERMITLVNTLLNISRIESGRIIIEPVPTDLKKLVDEVIVELQPRIEAKNHKLVISVHGDLPQLNLDPKLVRHVYMNLLTNAIKYTPNGGEIMIIISKSGNEVISQISDNGYGIPKLEHDLVFSKFYRSKNIAQKETDGTGLGLYLTKAIVDSSGGKIWFESEEGKGTTFWFILPLKGMPFREGEVTIDP